MLNQQNYAAKLAVAKSLTPKQIKEPSIPMGIFLQEAEDLHQIALADKEALMDAGLAEQLITELPVHAGAARQAQSLWAKEMQMRQDTEEEWHNAAPQAYELRDHLLHAFTYAFRSNSKLMDRVQDIRQGNSHADMIQDLNDLAVLGTEELPLLLKIHFDTKLLKQAASTSAELADLLARTNGLRSQDNECKDMRDRMYSLLKAAVDEIRSCGKYVFWQDSKHSKLYSSAYKRHTRRKHSETPQA